MDTRSPRAPRPAQAEGGDAAGGRRAYLGIHQATKDFGAFRALESVTMEIARGEFVCFLGPSGCGKTTLLRCIAGLESLNAGRIVQDGADVTRLPPSKRDFGIVFQSYALFPNLTVAQNVGFGLGPTGMSRAEIEGKAREFIELVGLRGQERKYPAQISGGQQQRVALARALAPSPGLLLLDEPLSALDAQVRAHLRREIASLQRRLGITTIMVTHDQEEALTMADRIVVLRNGRLEQVGTPLEIYRRPASPFVAGFIGVMNFVDGIVSGPQEIRCGSVSLRTPPVALPKGAKAICAFRAEHLRVEQAGDAADNVFQGSVADSEYLGSYLRLYVKSPLSGELRADVEAASADRPGMAPGATVSLRVSPEHVHVYPAGGA